MASRPLRAAAQKPCAHRPRRDGCRGPSQSYGVRISMNRSLRRRTLGATWAGALVVGAANLAGCFTAPAPEGPSDAGSATLDAGEGGAVTGPVVMIARDGGTPIS